MQNNRIELPDGGWADLRDPAAVPVRLRRPVESAIMAIGRDEGTQAALSADGDITDPQVAAGIVQKFGDDTIARYNDLNDLLIVARVAAWSYDVPVTLDAVLDLPAGVYEVLQVATADRITDMMPSFSASHDPASPTKPFSD